MVALEGGAVDFGKGSGRDEYDVPLIIVCELSSD
jgi:hypothetical protein